MLRSPGTKRRCVEPIPEEVLLKLTLLGARLIWDLDRWTITLDGSGIPVTVIRPDPTPEEWDFCLDDLADRICKNARPPGWQNTQHVDTMPIEAAAVINEEAFRSE